MISDGEKIFNNQGETIGNIVNGEINIFKEEDMQHFCNNFYFTTKDNREGICVDGIIYIRESLSETYLTTGDGVQRTEVIPKRNSEGIGESHRNAYLQDLAEETPNIIEKIIKHNIEYNKNMETNKVTVVEELDDRFNSSLGELNNHRDKLANVIRRLTGESLKESVGVHVDEIPNQLEVEPSTIQRLDKHISRLEEVNRDFGKLYEILNQYL